MSTYGELLAMASNENCKGPGAYLINAQDMKEYLLYQLQHNYCVLIAPNDFIMQMENTVYSGKENKHCQIVGNILNPIYVCKKTKKFIKYFKNNGVLPNTLLMITMAVANKGRTSAYLFDIRDQRLDISDEVKLETLTVMVNDLVKYSVGVST